MKHKKRERDGNRYLQEKRETEEEKRERAQIEEEISFLEERMKKIKRYHGNSRR